MFTEKRDKMRQVFFDAWKKNQKKMPLDALELQLIQIMALHPEYHAFLHDPKQFMHADFLENNPFLHMSLHMGLREQIATDRPAGIKNIFIRLSEKCHDLHEAEHLMMEALAKILLQAEKNGAMPSENEYLAWLNQL
jgi:hypothetical protein